MSTDVYRNDTVGLNVTRLSAGIGRGVVYQVTVEGAGGAVAFTTLSAEGFRRFADAVAQESLAPR